MTPQELKIESFYRAALIEIISGTDIKDIKSIISDFEEEEMYEECAGILRAIKLVESGVSIEELKLEYKLLVTKDGH